MIPISISFNSFIETKIEQKSLDNINAKIKIQQSELQFLEEKNALAKSDLKIKELTDSIRHLNNAMVSVQSFGQVLELSLIETSLRQTELFKETLNTVFEKNRILPDENYYEEFLGVLTNDIRAKFGVDLKEIKLNEIESVPNTILVSGITPKLTSISDKPRWEVKEIRKYDVGVSKNARKIQIYNDAENLRRADNKANEILSGYIDKLNKGLETDFMNESIIKITENFVKILLSPLEKRIVFTDKEKENALPLINFLQDKIKEKNTEIETLKKHKLSIE
jgi:hypothetical protein